MNTLMLVTPDKALEEALASELSSLPDADNFGIRAAATSAEAAHVLVTTPVDLVLAELSVPDEEAQLWLSAMRDARPDAPFLILAGKEAAPNLAGFKGIWLVRKPAPPKKLLEAAISLAKKEAKAFVAGAHIGYFLQVITSDNKTCSLTVRSRGRIGTLFFMEGQLINAVFGTLRGKEAALAILCWQEETNIEVRKLYSAKKRVIRESVEALIMESCRLKDTAAAEESARTNAPAKVSGDLVSLVLGVEGLTRMAVIMRDGTLLAQKNGGDHLGALLSYMSMELERVRALMDWTGPDHVAMTCKNGEKYLVIFGPEVIVGLQTSATASTAQALGALKNAVARARIQG